MSVSPSRPTLLWIQALRALAALAVVVAHTHAETGWFAVYQHKPDVLPSFVTGAAGVDLFFVISGFVMVYASEGLFGSPAGARTFLLRRLLRIVPLYWLVIAATLIMWQHLGVSWEQQRLTWSDIPPSMFFYAWPHYMGGSHDPIVTQSWSLNYEMFFYFVFAIAVLLRPRVAILGTAIALFLFGRYSAFLPFSLPFLLQVFANQNLWEFALGLMIGFAFREGLRAPKMVGIALMATGLGVMIAMSFGSTNPDRFTFWGLSSALIVCGAVMMPNPSLASTPWRVAALLGDSSYAIYLTHGLTMPYFRMGWATTATWLSQWPWLYAIFIVIASVVVGCIVHVAIERPITSRLKKLVLHLRGSGPVAALAPAT